MSYYDEVDEAEEVHVPEEYVPWHVPQEKRCDVGRTVRLPVDDPRLARVSHVALAVFDDAVMRPQVVGGLPPGFPSTFQWESGTRIFGVDSRSSAGTAFQIGVDAGGAQITASQPGVTSFDQNAFLVNGRMYMQRGRVFDPLTFTQLGSFPLAPGSSAVLAPDLDTGKAFFLTQAALPHVIAARGNIVNVASSNGLMGTAYTGPYSATKAALISLTKTLAMEYVEEPIRVNAVCPGPIYTPFHEKRNQAIGRTFEQYREDAARGTLLRRHGTPDEVAACILFLASDDASYVTGTLLFVDGGYTAM